ncbi:MAG: tRNA uridine-5-carboxymethylaminomethyl(34) synthesis enzyme MnmG, partial [Planctomycetota bacterium]
VAREVAEQIVHDVKYAGYLRRQDQQVERQNRLSDQRIPANFDYQRLTQLRFEARQKLSQIRPVSLAQASRISGITPADIALLLTHLS